MKIPILFEIRDENLNPKTEEHATFVIKNYLKEKGVGARIITKKGWRPLSDKEISEIIEQNRTEEIAWINGVPHIRDESKDEYAEAEIRVVG